MKEEAKKIQLGSTVLFANDLQKDITPEGILRRFHLRKTSLRKEILIFFLKQKSPVSVLHIASFFKTSESPPNIASIYRQIDVLEKKGIIRGFFLNEDERFFEMVGEHHHHFICTDCRAIDCIEDKTLETALFESESALAAKGFRVRGHSLYFSGKCQKCAPAHIHPVVVL